MNAYTAVQARFARDSSFLLDGGIGGELVRNGIRWREHGLRTDAAAVEALHLEYRQADADAVVLLNCAPPDDVTAGSRELVRRRSNPTGVYAHGGRFDPPEWLFADDLPPTHYVDLTHEWIQIGARVVGGYRGTTPDRLARLAATFGTAT